MPRIVWYELKKLFSLPVLVLWAASAVILLALMAGRYANLTGQSSMDSAGIRAISMEYAGPLNQELADQAIRDWRALPDEWSSRDTPEAAARRMVLRTLDEEFAIAAAGIPAAEPPKNASPDAILRLAPMLETAPVPFIHGYWEGWRALLAALDGEAGWLCAVMAAFGVSALFSGEGSSGMAACVRTTRHGRQALALGKITAAAAYASLCALLCVGLPLAASAALFGLQGGELPAQFAGSLDSPISYPLSLGQYAGLRAAMAAMGALVLCACTALLSAMLPSVTTPAVAAVALFAAPILLAQMKLESPVLDCILRYLPSRLLLAQPLMKAVQAVQLWRSALWQPAWLCILWAALLPMMGMLAARQWRRVRREEPITQD